MLYKEINKKFNKINNKNNLEYKNRIYIKNKKKLS